MNAVLALLCVVVVTLIAWRGLLSAELFSDDYALIETAEREDLATSLRVHGPGFFGPGGDLYFRPLWRLAIELVHTLGGAEPRAWFVTALALHLCVVLALFALALRWTARPWLCAAGACAFALAPGPAQAVAWPAAALNTPPSALLLLLAGAALWTWIERDRPRALALALLFLALSFGFREAGYHFLPLTLIALLFMRPLRARMRGVLVAVLGVGALVGLHYALCNRVEAGDSLRGIAVASLRGTAIVLRDLVGLDAPRALVLASAAGLWIAAFAWARPRTRFALVWAACALFPYVAKYPSSRFQYLFQLPMWLAAMLLAAEAVERGGRHARALRSGGVALLALLAVANARRLPAAQAEYARAGVACRNTFAALAEIDFTGVRTIAVDAVPHALENALPAMLHRLGADTRGLVLLVAFREPPFLLYGGELGELGDATSVVLLWQEDEARYRRVTLAELATGLTPLPLFALRHRVRVVAGPTEAVAALTSPAAAVDTSARQTDEVWLYAEPSPPLAGTPSLSRCTVVGARSRRVELEVESDADGYLVLHVPGRLAGEQAVLVNGAPALLVPADGPFHAVRLGPGRHRVVVRANAFTVPGE
jgi:hypothetical protein